MGVGVVVGVGGCAHNYMRSVFVCVNSVCVHIVIVIAEMFEWLID